MKELTHILNKFLSDKGSVYGTMHKFSEIYDDYFKNIKNCKYILEIGVQDGASLNAWKEYFTEATIIGLDINDKTQFNDNRIQCFIADQSNIEDLIKFKKFIPYEFDLILDDGSHHMRDQQITLSHFLPLLKPGGIYIIEDLHTSNLKNGDDLYGRPAEIYIDKKNTTLYFLENINEGSVYISTEENEYLKNNIKEIKIFKNNNKNNESYGSTSITSIIIKSDN